MRVFMLRATSVVVLALLSACTSGDSSTGANGTEAVVTDSSGVRMVAIAAGELPLADSLVEVTRIAPTDTGLARFGALFSSNVTTNGTDRIYVFANDDAQIVVFDDDGTPLARWGRRGQGPGEFEFANDLSVGPDGTVSIYDYNRSAFVRFTPEGELAPEIRLPRDTGPRMESPGREFVNGFLYSTRQQIGDSVTRTFRFATPQDTSIIAAHTIAVTPDLAFTSCPVRMRGVPPYFASDMTMHPSPRGLAVQRGGDWRVEWYEGVTLREVWTRAMPTRATSMEILEQELEGGMRISFGGGSAPCTIPVAEVAEVRGMAPTLPALRGIAVAPDGTLWAERFQPKGNTRKVDVIRADGTLLGTITGRGAPLGFLSGGRVLFSETDPDTDLMSMVILQVPNANW